MVSAEFFDVFGLLGFAILLFSGMKVMKSKDKKVVKYGLIITLISLIGLIIDSYIVTKTFILN